MLCWYVCWCVVLFVFLFFLLNRLSCFIFSMRLASKLSLRRKDVMYKLNTRYAVCSVTPQQVPGTKGKRKGSDGGEGGEKKT